MTMPNTASLTSNPLACVGEGRSGRSSVVHELFHRSAKA